MKKSLWMVGLVANVVGVARTAIAQPGYVPSASDELTTVLYDSLNTYETVEQLANNRQLEPGSRVRVAEGAVKQGELCQEKVQAALDSGMSPSTAIQIPRGPQITLEQALSGCQDLINKANEVLASTNNAVNTELSSKLAPYANVLSGDKLEIVRKELMNSGYEIVEYRGAGGRSLDTPQDLRNASSWFRVSVNNQGIVPIWTIYAYRFQGMKLVSTDTVASGEGENPPSSAFR